MADGLSHSRRCALSTNNPQISGEHTDFPVLFTVANLPAEMFDADGPWPAQDGGGDIRFTLDNAGDTLLACEVVTFNTASDPANGEAEIWVLLPNVRASQADTIYVWWHTPSADSQPSVSAAHGREAVWPSAVFVGHCESAAVITDSTGNGNGTTVGNPASVAGRIGRGIAMARSPDGYVDLGRAPLAGATTEHSTSLISSGTARTSASSWMVCRSAAMRPTRRRPWRPLSTTLNTSANRRTLRQMQPEASSTRW